MNQFESRFHRIHKKCFALVMKILDSRLVSRDETRFEARRDFIFMTTLHHKSFFELILKKIRSTLSITEL